MYNLQSQKQYKVHIGEECSPLQHCAWHMDLALLLPLAYLQTQTYKSSCTGSLALIRCAPQYHSSQAWPCKHASTSALELCVERLQTAQFACQGDCKADENRKADAPQQHTFFAVTTLACTDASSAAQSPATIESCLCRCMQHVQVETTFSCSIVFCPISMLMQASCI